MGIYASTLTTTDINATSGTVQNLRFAPQYDGGVGGRGPAPGQLDRPRGVAVDGAGLLYVADTLNNRTSVFNGTGHHAGTITDGFDSPRGVAVGGPSGYVYVADTNRHRVAVFDPAGGHVADLNGTLLHPHGVAVNGTGHVFVADTRADRVAVFGPGWNHAYDLPGTFNRPQDVAVGGPAGMTYVADTNGNRVAVFGPGGDHAYDLPATFNRPRGVAVDSFSGAVYVTDTLEDTVRAFDPAGRSIANITGFFNRPFGIAVDGTAGTVYVADRNGHSVRVFDPAYSFEVAGLSDGQTLTVNLPAGSVDDRTGHPNAASNTVTVGLDLDAPRILSAAITSPGQITVEYGEPVHATGAAYGALTVGGAPRNYTGSPLSGNGTSVHVLAFTGGAAAPDSTGNVTLAPVRNNGCRRQRPRHPGRGSADAGGRPAPPDNLGRPHGPRPVHGPVQRARTRHGRGLWRAHRGGRHPQLRGRPAVGQRHGGPHARIPGRPGRRR